jgi:flagellar protein FlaH
MMTKAQPNAVENERTVISSGNVELDSRMGGGLPLRSLTLIEGSSGAGKSVLSQQILWGALNDGLRATFFTSENTVKTLIWQMQTINLEVQDFLLLRKLRVYPVEMSQLGQKAPRALLDAIKQEYEGSPRPQARRPAGQSKSGADVVMIDSLTPAVSRASDDSTIISFFEECKRLCSNGATILVTLHANAVSPELIGIIRSMCDANLQLRAEQDGQRLVKTLQVGKIRGASSSTGAIVGFEVEPGWGMRVIPISKARG